MSTITPFPEDRLAVTTPAAAYMLSTSTRTVKRMLADGRLQGVKIGRSTRIRVRDLESIVGL
jgi:excisionase family DNA binding protein